MHKSSNAPDPATWYLRYNEICNRHQFSLLGEYVHQDVRVNGERQGLDSYISGLESVVAAFPDYRWELQHLVVSGDRIAAHFLDSGHHSGTWLGVPPTGRRVQTQEFAFYQVARGLIVEVWVSADNLQLLEQIR